MVAKMSVPITLVKPCEMVSSCSIHSFCEVWMVSGGCGAVAAGDQKELLWRKKSCQNSKKLLGDACGLMTCSPSFLGRIRLIPRSVPRPIHAGRATKFCAPDVQKRPRCGPLGVP